MLNVGLISYKKVHKKTLYLAKSFQKKKYNVFIFAFPFHFKKKKKIKEKFGDRPSQIIQGKKWQEVTTVKIINIPSWKKKDSFLFRKISKKNKIQYFICCTKKIIPAYYLYKEKFLNCHPGLLPQSRGVDSLKKSIIKSNPIGVTLHLINRKIDSGKILKRERILIKKKHTLKDIFRLCYQKELNLLEDFERYIHFEKKNWLVTDQFKLSKSKISKNENDNLEQIFKKNKNKLIKKNKKSYFPHISEV